MRKCIICLVALVEPCLHAFGLPHPEGLSSIAINYLMTTDENV